MPGFFKKKVKIYWFYDHMMMILVASKIQNKKIRWPSGAREEKDGNMRLVSKAM